MIKIIKGVFGYREGAFIIPKTPNDAPFSLSSKDEERLVTLGVAEYVGDTRNNTPVENDAKDYNLDMKLVDLKAIAREKYGVDATSEISKAGVIALIEGRITGKTDEAPPEFTAIDPVV